MGEYAIQKTIYNGLVLPVCYGAVRAAAPFHHKLRRTIQGRRALRERWARAKDSMKARPVWFHVASVGEYEQARPLITALGHERPEIPVALSVTSPSGHGYISRKEKLDGKSNIRFFDYLPFDFSANARFCLAALDPRLLVFVKFDLWPNLVWEASNAGTPLALIDATLSESSKRNSAAGRRFYRAVYSKLNKVLAISEADAQRFLECVPGHPCVTVVGDTRFDRVMERKKARGDATPRVRKDGRLTVIAGSTWPRDEAHLLGALARLAKSDPSILVIVAPHEPSPQRVEELLSWARSQELTTATLGEHARAEGQAGREQVIVVDTVGVLAELYEYGDIAYVGGSFSTGVHNVIEPAIMGIPVLFGPVHANSFEALELLRFGAAVQTANEAEIFDALKTLAEDSAKRARMGGDARRYVQTQLGATERCLEALREYL